MRVAPREHGSAEHQGEDRDYVEVYGRLRRIEPGLARTALVAAGFLVIAACGGGSGSSGSSEPISLGLMGPLTGARAGVGQGMVTGANLALDIINQHGGVLGHQVKLDAQDDAGDPGDARSGLVGK